MKTYKIFYRKNGNKYVTTLGAENEKEAKAKFYLSIPCDDIESIEEVK